MNKNIQKSIKTIIIILVLFLCFICTSCTKLSEEEISYSGNEYIINYYIGDSLVDLNPKTYVSGDTVVLPNLAVEGFEGWYFSSSFTGKRIKYLSETSYGNKNLYAHIDDKNSNLINNEPFKDGLRLNDVINNLNSGRKITRAMPSLGNIKALVIPVDFTDCKADNDMKKVLETALFGSSYETGWESLKSYYYKSSYGALSIDGLVTDVYHTNKRSSHYAYQNDYEGVNEIIKEALEYFDKDINYDEFDSDNDGYIDALYIVYSHNVEYDNDSIWWAYTDEYFTESYEYYDNVEADFYCFLGYDFLFEEPRSGAKIKYNCETFIHETGHLLGLDDYYDYDSDDYYNMGGLGGCDMMDNNIGDHNAYSKTILNWITPEVISLDDFKDEKIIKLRPFQSSGDAIIITKKYNNTFYDEYYILSFYTPDGLNTMEAGFGGLFNTSGICLYHVNSLLSKENVDSVWDITMNNNASSRTKLIELVEADGKNNISSGGQSTNSDLFKLGEINSLKWSDGSDVNISISIETLDDNYCLIKISVLFY